MSRSRSWSWIAYHNVNTGLVFVFTGGLLTVRLISYCQISPGIICVLVIINVRHSLEGINSKYNM